MISSETTHFHQPLISSQAAGPHGDIRSVIETTRLLLALHRVLEQRVTYTVSHLEHCSIKRKKLGTKRKEKNKKERKNTMENKNEQVSKVLKFTKNCEIGVLLLG